jgi:hypothetical integral membrane protein (TIGR02206 family)
MFSAVHLGALAVLALIVAALVVVYRRADPARRRRLRTAIGWTVLLLEVARQTGTLASGHYSADILPLHVCAIATASVFVDSHWPNRWTGDFLYALGWWGALAADLFPDWSTRPILNVYTWQSFLIHALIFGYVLMRLVAGDFIPNVANLWRVALMAAVFGGIGAAANAAWGTNFWFLNAGAPGSPLEAIHTVAGPLYLPVLTVLMAVLWALLYLPWVVRSRRLSQRPVADAER